MGGVRNDSIKPFKKDDKRAAIDPKCPNVTSEMSYVIHPKYILSEPFSSSDIEFLYDRSRSSAYTVCQWTLTLT